jgi:hypothetical protein
LQGVWIEGEEDCVELQAYFIFWKHVSFILYPLI